MSVLSIRVRAGAVLACSAVAAAACGPGTGTGHAPGAMARTGTPSPGRPVIVARTEIKRAVGPESAAYGHGSVWLAFGGGVSKYPPGRPLPGRLLRISAGTLRVTASWPIVGSPVGLAVTRQYVWVAGDDGDGKPAAYDASHVQQFTLDGALAHSYRVPSPQALAGPGTGDSAELRHHRGLPAHSGWCT